jgi:hypothetical protein
VIKPIKGSWCEFQHHNKAEGIYWNPACARFTPADWDAKIAEMASVGLEYLVLMAVALDYKAFYPTDLLPSWELPCEDPLEALLTAADAHDVRIFVGNGFWGQWDSPGIIADPEARRRRLAAMDELAERYGDHASFYGWYWANEAEIRGHFKREFIDYVVECGRHARTLMPDAPTLIAPYGTNMVQADDAYARQLEELEVDIVAYQDEIGVRKSEVEDISAYYEALRQVHDRVPQVALWADVEVFEFEAEVYRSALLPASFERVEKQLKAVSPYVDTVLIYQYLGMMNRPDSAAFAGHETSTRLCAHYLSWLRQRNIRAGS